MGRGISVRTTAASSSAKAEPATAKPPASWALDKVVAACEKLCAPVDACLGFTLYPAARNGGLQDDVLDPRRQGVTRDDEAIFGRNNRLMTANKSVLRDQFSRGVNPDMAAERDFPYECKHDGRRFLTATQLSEYYLESYGERIHASLIRPANAARLADIADDSD